MPHQDERAVLRKRRRPLEQLQQRRPDLEAQAHPRDGRRRAGDPRGRDHARTAWELVEALPARDDPGVPRQGDSPELDAVTAEERPLKRQRGSQLADIRAQVGAYGRERRRGDACGGAEVGRRLLRVRALRAAVQSDDDGGEQRDRQEKHEEGCTDERRPPIEEAPVDRHQCLPFPFPFAFPFPFPFALPLPFPLPGSPSRT